MFREGQAEEKREAAHGRGQIGIRDWSGNLVRSDRGKGTTGRGLLPGQSALEPWNLGRGTLELRGSQRALLKLSETWSFLDVGAPVRALVVGLLGCDSVLSLGGC